MATLDRRLGALATCVLLAAGTAYADEPTLTDPPNSPTCEQLPADCPGAQAQTEPAPPPPMAMVEPAIQKPWYDTIGYGLSLGGGVDGFVGDAFRDLTNTGGSWNLRFTAGTRSYLALELSYIGSAQGIDAIGLDNDAVLVGNGLQAALRINFLRNYVVQPFVYGGAAWRNYTLSNTIVNVSDVNDSDDVFEIPVGVGVAGYISGFMADLRAEYRAAWGNDLVPVLDEDDEGAIVGSADRWGVMADLGVQF
jgi:hypothetical protein